MKRFVLIGLLLIILVPNILVFAQNQSAPKCIPNSTSKELCNPIDYAADFKTFAPKLIQIFTTFFAITALIMVVFSGLRMVMSRGDTEAVTKAKSALQWSVSGLILALFAFVIVQATATYLGARDLTGTDIGHVAAQNPLTAPDFLTLLTTMLTNFLAISGVLAVAMIVFGGFKYITARGDEEQVTSAKSTLWWSIIGLVIILLAYVIVRATLTFFNP